MDQQAASEKSPGQPAVKARKRNAADAESIPETVATGRSKRGKYTTVACDDCKKKKLKCIPTTDDRNCERCVSGGLSCTFGTTTVQLPKDRSEKYNQSLGSEISQLRQQVSELIVVVHELKQQTQRPQSQNPATVSPHTRDNIAIHSPASARSQVPRQPHFVGPTRSAFGILVGERSLNRIGVPKFDSMPPSGAQSPVGPTSDEPISDLEFWNCCTANDVTRYLVTFQEEVESVYPFIDIGDYIAQSKEVLQIIQGSSSITDDERLCSQDITLTKVAIATGLILDEPSKIELTTAMVDSVQLNLSSILSPQVDLKEIQLLAMLSIYYFHSGEELLAWRTIGIAAREALEMGLHRKRSLLDNFKDTDSRRLATRVFWCVYVLDRRWSFGTSLSFALVDKDIDPELPKPDEEYLYLQCMVGYGQLCSRIWEAIPPFGSASQSIPDDTAAALDLQTQDWLESIPSHLRLRHPRLGLAPRAQPRLPHRLRALLYLRGNYVRILIYRHHLMSTDSIASSPQSAWLVVDIAQDTIQVLVHLHSTTDIYSRQQSAFNYFLLSALAVLFLAVCHAPETFSAPCRRTFSDGVDLVRGLSRHSMVSKRLWKSIRGVIPRIKSFGFPTTHNESQEQSEGNGEATGGANGQVGPTQLTATVEEQMPVSTIDGGALPFGDIVMPEGDFLGSVPDMFQMRNDLLDLFDAIGQGQQFLQPVPGAFTHDTDFTTTTDETHDISMRFQGLI